MKNILLIFSIALLALSCNSNSGQKKTQVTSPAQEAVDQSIAYHGMENLDQAQFVFQFREMFYTYEMQSGRYEYTRIQTDSIGQQVVDRLTNEGLIRFIEGDSVALKEEKRAAYARSVNSVIYFFRLPFGLNDQAVIKSYQGETEIKRKTYHEVKITFEQSGGGEDYEDVFLYWFDVEDHSMDYLAYLYHTDGGGMRFREAINARRINGVLVQDYINYKPEDENMEINGIDELYEAGELEELSRIINEDVKIDFYKP